MVARRSKFLTLATPRRRLFGRGFSLIPGWFTSFSRRQALLASGVGGLSAFLALTGARADQLPVATTEAPAMFGPIAGSLAIGLVVGAGLASFVLVRRHAAKLRDFHQEKRLR